MSKNAAFDLLHRAIEHHQAGRLAQAEGLYREILAQVPDCSDALHYLGVIAHQRGHHDVAVGLISRAAILAPGDPAIHSNLGEACRQLNRLDEAVASFRRALALQPDYPQALSNLGNALVTQGRLDEAITCFRRALELQPGFANAHNNLGIPLMEQGRWDEALACFRQALALQPDFAAARNNLGKLYRDRGQLDAAAGCFEQALALRPDFAEAHNNLGGVFKDRGQLAEALACYRRALALRPRYSTAHSNLILALHYRSGDDAGVIDAELRRWNDQHSGPLVKFIQFHANDRSLDRRLRIGYLSPDFRSHPVGWFLRPLFAAHARQSFELFCYSNGRCADDVTAQLRCHADGWHDVAGQSDQEVANLIRQDRIDILVDLALHTAGNRLPVFAHKPAPVQATYLGYPGKSGLDAVDYRITDPYLDPSEIRPADGPEQPVLLPETYWCYQPIVHPSPEVAPLSALAAGYVTFGCMNNFCKVTPATLDAWCRLLAAVPNSLLLLHAPPGSVRSRLHELFSRNGIKPNRLRFADQISIAQYFQSYHAIDIALDPFPFPGGTTTCDALWMGVPVITLAGPTPVTRGGSSLLSNIGLPELIAHSVDDYLRKAAALARDLPRLVTLRAGLRDRMLRSPLMDAPRFARAVEGAYRSMWRQWCARSVPAAASTR